MNAIDFLIKTIDSIVKKYPHIKCRYEVDEFSKSHFIEILPKKFHELDGSFLNEELEIIHNFINRFPYETLTFTTDGGLYTIEKPYYIATGESFKKQGLTRKRRIS
jgi:hypothetical protein